METPHTPSPDAGPAIWSPSRRALIGGLVLSSVGAPLLAQVQKPGTSSPPDLLAAFGSGWVPKGSGPLRFFGFKAYDATLWLTGDSQGVFSFSKAFALDILYNTTVKASDINNTSLIEMSRISAATTEQVQAWSAILGSLFVDVKSGDRLIGVHLPGAGARFFINANPQGETKDTDFSEAFFKIWLDPKARKPELRAALLGL
jgi:hypothetical protein